MTTHANIKRPIGIMLRLVLSVACAWNVVACSQFGGVVHETLSAHAQKQYPQAIESGKRWFADVEGALGPYHPRLIGPSSTLANSYIELGRFEEALALYKRIFEIQERTLGPEHPDTALGLENVAATLGIAGRYEEAIPFYQRAMAIYEKQSGPLHPDTARSLYGIGLMLERAGRYDEALIAFHRTREIREQALGPNNQATAQSLVSVGRMLIRVGRYAEATNLLQRGLAIGKEEVDSESQVTAFSLSGLATIASTMGRHEHAQSLYQRAHSIREESLGSDHRSTAFGMIANGVSLFKLGRGEEALALLKRALEAQEKSLGLGHPDLAQGLNATAWILIQLYRYDEAEPLLKRALAIQEKHLRHQHPDIAESLNALAVLYRRTKRIDEALLLYKRAVHILLVGETNVDLGRDFGKIELWSHVTSNLGVALRTSDHPGAIDEAIFYYKLSVNARQRMREGTRGLDETTRLSFTKTVEGTYNGLASLLIERGRVGEAERVLLLLKESALTQYLRRNGSNEEAQPQSLAWTRAEDAYRLELEHIAARWRDHHAESAALAESVKLGNVRGDGPEALAVEQRRMQLESQTRNVMENATTRFAEESRADHARRLVALDSARTELSVKLGQLQRHADRTPRTAGLMLLPSERGLFIIVTTDKGAVPMLRPVSEAELSGLVKRLREAIAVQGDYRPTAAALYEHLIAPAEAQLGGAKDIEQWAVLPFGSLATVPFAALVGSDGKHLVERYALAILTADGTGRLDGLETPPRQTWRSVGLGASQADPEFGNVALPGVRQEICGVVREESASICRAGEGVIPGLRYIDPDFTRQRLQFLLGATNGDASVMHIATHFKLERSELLTGEGKLSTRDLLAWNPRFGTYDLIALSACDSGSGDTNLESLAGLLRSKGAKAVLATLWPVADVGAAPLMVEFYAQRGERRRMSKSEALRNAQLKMLHGLLNDGSDSLNMTHPYFWAPFVLMGNWL